jgi:hypothetical protein
MIPERRKGQSNSWRVCAGCARRVGLAPMMFQLAPGQADVERGSGGVVHVWNRSVPAKAGYCLGVSDRRKQKES